MRCVRTASDSIPIGGGWIHLRCSSKSSPLVTDVTMQRCHVDKDMTPPARSLALPPKRWAGCHHNLLYIPLHRHPSEQVSVAQRWGSQDTSCDHATLSPPSDDLLVSREQRHPRMGSLHRHKAACALTCGRTLHHTQYSLTPHPGSCRAQDACQGICCHCQLGARQLASKQRGPFISPSEIAPEIQLFRASPKDALQVASQRI